MVDANSRLPSGIFDGTHTNFGDYDECKSISAKDFRGKYCVLDIIPPVPEVRKFFSGERVSIDINTKNSTLHGTVYEKILARAQIFRITTFYNGICVPSSCSDIDIKKVFENGIYKSNFYITVLKYNF